MPATPSDSYGIQPETYGLGWPTIAQARDFFFQLEKSSAVLRGKIAGSPALAPYGRDYYSGGPIGLPQATLPPDPQVKGSGPGGVVLHFTAGGSLESAVKWFCDPTLRSGRSAHMVIARGPEPKLRQVGTWAAECPLIAQLPALPVQCRLPMTAAVASAWANGWAANLELVCWGCGNTDAAATAAGYPQAAGRRWQPYTAAQLAVAAYVIRCIRTLYGTFTPAQVWGHEHVQTVATPGSEGINKLDAGPLLPMAEIRAAVRSPADKPESPNDTLVGDILDALGYGRGTAAREGLRMAQYSLGLIPDGQAGPKTQTALAARVQERLGLSRPLGWAQVAQRLPALQAWRWAALASLEYPPANV